MFSFGRGSDMVLTVAPSAPGERSIGPSCWTWRLECASEPRVSEFRLDGTWPFSVSAGCFGDGCIDLGQAALTDRVEWYSVLVLRIQLGP
jgi:hypothetical protein